MATGLLAILDDAVAIAKIAAASSADDVIAQAGKSGLKAAGVVIDDAAVAPAYVVGFKPDRELPIVWRITKGSLFNKTFVLLPGALVLGTFAPWVITPLLMVGGVYLSYEGAEKIVHAFSPQHPHVAETSLAVAGATGSIEDDKVRSAVRTDLILSAEIMAIALASIPADMPFVEKALVLGLVGVGITLVVYGAVAVIVKADDVGLALARRPSRTAKAIGQAMVDAMPMVLRTLSVVGTAAMVWVGGGIVVHGLETFGIETPAHVVHDAAVAASSAVPIGSGVVEWAIAAAASGLVGLGVGVVVMPLVGLVSGLVGRFRGKT